MFGYHRLPPTKPLPPLGSRFGVRSRTQLFADLRRVASHLLPRDRYIVGPSSVGLLRPDLSLLAYMGLVPDDHIAPIYNFFDRTSGGPDWRARVTRRSQRDYRGGRLSYDEHDGTDFVCPPGTPIVAAAAGTLVATRDRWLRGGLTACLDHGDGLVTQYTHLTEVTVPVGSQLKRGDTFALSGVSGIDIMSFFPWVPPHLHFSVWDRGVPIDPYLAAGEADRAGTWTVRNDPRPPGELLRSGPPPALGPVDVERALEVIGTCKDPLVRSELERAPSDHARIAILEDSLHHDGPAWPQELRHTRFRGPTLPKTRLTLPLDPSLYVGARAADLPGL